MGVPISTDPATLARQALGATSTGSWLNSIGLGFEGVSNAVAGAYQAKVASNNARLADADAENALLAGNEAGEQSNLRTDETIGAEKAAQGANGIDVNTGSAVRVRQATADLGEYDAAVIRYNAARAAYGYKQQASDYRTQSTLDKMATGFNIAGDSAKVYSSFISSSTALANQRLNFGISGVPVG